MRRFCFFTVKWRGIKNFGSAKKRKADQGQLCSLGGQRGIKSRRSLIGNIANGVQRLLLTASFDPSEQIGDCASISTADAVDTVSESQPMATLCVSDYRLIEHGVSITAAVMWNDTVNTLVTKQWFRIRCRGTQGSTQW